MKTFFVEPFVFLFMFGVSIKSVTFQDLLLLKTCTDLNVTTCANLRNDSIHEAAVQRMANNYQMLGIAIATIPSAIVTIMLGPWSDRHGRKIPMILPLFGMIIENILCIFLVRCYQIPSVYILLAYFSGGILGGFSCVITGIYSYVSDVSSSNSRTFRYGVADLFFALGLPTGTLTGGQIFKYWGYSAVFGTSAVILLLAILYIWLFLGDSLLLDNKSSFKRKILDIFNVSDWKESIYSCLKKRPGNARARILLLVISMCFIVVSYIGNSTIGYLYAQRMYNWDVTMYSNVSTIFTILSVVIMTGILPLLTKVFVVKDAVLGILGLTSYIGQSLGRAFAFQEWTYYAASAFGTLNGAAPVAVRASLSKSIHNNEIGKVFSFLAVCEAVTPIVAGVVFSQVYNCSLGIFLGIVYLMSIAWLLVPLAVFLWLLCQEPVKIEYEPINTSSDIVVE
ncbi:solute carrier family 46 member 3-like [Limulus polyphemus]|uniref:Solute carrier family 46 member 3-like n=1 Tax=Limulus polyphemus TaxID=6850 RepID=A0ABM1ST15_LIMPO|nr:solute carrier family 46 member 3-like [Limulus polyphemus]XP_013779033.1 solute carrier family 46 member 3-like [Limulus polyphemus]XP_013779035.1 solute carrier family 46 member 3-like [Limulus polyphemus]XP_022246768.1 solute carrier family 46 member 3-like [Limulus polyphemus]XP_022246769.1 solute carrier family 46 member 3-like [Limulus polyphemus]XP_022246771.1 solute carrier family 46 member 3-like [Limulus polyphemus]